MSDGDLRMLGAVDGFAHSLIRVRAEINFISGRYSPQIPAKHVRKKMARDKQLRPLLDLEAWLVEQHRSCKDAYAQTCKSSSNHTEEPRG